MPVSPSDDASRGWRASWIVSIGAAVALYLLAASAQDARAQSTTRVSVDSGGAEASDHSFEPAISADGRFVAFDSDARNLVADDTNSRRDVFVHDRSTGVTTRVSVTSGGSQADEGSFSPAISADGRFVAFQSAARNLVANDTNGQGDVFVHDRSTGATSRVSVASGGAEANDDSFELAISADGRFVAFDSFATNLVANDTNSRLDVFVHDRSKGATSRVSVASGGAEADANSSRPAISADGRFVAFESLATNLVARDTTGGTDVFRHDRSTGAMTRVSVASGGAQGNASSFEPAISADGQLVAFQSGASNLVANDTNGRGDVFLRNHGTGSTTRVSVATGGAQGNAGALNAAISAGGRFVLFESFASNLVANDTNGRKDVFVRDRGFGLQIPPATTRVSVSSGGAQAFGGDSQASGLSADGRFVVFDSNASDLVANDTNGRRDVFVHDRGAFGARTRVTLALAAKRIPARGPLKVRVRNRIRFSVDVALSAKTTGPVSVGRRKRRVELRTRGFRAAGNSRKTVKMRLPRVLRRVLRRKGKLSLRLTAKATGPAGRTRTVRKTVTPRLKKPRRG